MEFFNMNWKFESAKNAVKLAFKNERAVLMEAMLLVFLMLWK
jgi:hypothetical protein